MRLHFRENISLAFDSIRSQLLKAIITISIITIGIFALVGILAVIDAIKGSVSQNFTEMGANTFTIRDKGINFTRRYGGRGGKNFEGIDFREAFNFKKEYAFPSTVSINVSGPSSLVVKYQSIKTNPTISIMGVDENYLTTSGIQISDGRNFTPLEGSSGSNLVIIGEKLRSKLFGEQTDPIGKTISLGSVKYRVIGCLEERGTGFGSTSDNMAFIPVNSLRQNFAQQLYRVNINALVDGPDNLVPAIEEATLVMRKIRKDVVGKEDSFEVSMSDGLSEQLIDLLDKVSIFAIVIAAITLIGASIALMNILIVSVTERTKEIGVRKALGANNRTVLLQFLIEAIVICQIGGIVGILFGLLAGFGVSSYMDSVFVIPWVWIITGFIVCSLVGLLSGIYPAYKASRLDPIDALRYE